MNRAKILRGIWGFAIDVAFLIFLGVALWLVISPFILAERP